MAGRGFRIRCRQGDFSGFSLIELLVVCAVLAVLMALVAPAINSLTQAKGVDAASYEISGALNLARSHAMANSTYTWVGFYEEDAGTNSPTTAGPPYTGTGRVVLGIVASNDGTKIFSEDDPGATLPANRLAPLSKVVKIENVHLGDLGAPAGGEASTFGGRPSSPYDGGGGAGKSRISSESSEATAYPFELQGYKFSKTVRFSPRGEADINGSGELRTYGEIGLQQSRGTTAVSTTNVAAVQFTGIAGNVKIYRP